MAAVAAVATVAAVPVVVAVSAVATVTAVTAEKRCKSDSIGVGATGAPRPWLFQATDLRGGRGRHFHVTLALRTAETHNTGATGP